MKKFAYFPGCNTTGLSKELDMSMRAIAPMLDMELVDIPEFVCCGTGTVQQQDPIAQLALNVRNFALASEQGLDILVVCSTCYGTMKQAIFDLNNDLEQKHECKSRLARSGYDVDEAAKVRVVHILDILFDQVKGGVMPLAQNGSDLRLAPFYGCRLLRPSDVCEFDDPVHPVKFESVLEYLGYEVVDWEGKTRCCGFDIAFVDQPAAIGMVKKRIGEARQSQADAIVTACPLCQNMLDGFGKKASALMSIPVLHLPQILGLAWGIEPAKLGLQRHIIPLKSNNQNA